MMHTKNNDQLKTMIKEMSNSLKEYENATRKEIDNILEIVKRKFLIMEKEQEKYYKIAKSLEEKYESAKDLINRPEELLYESIYNNIEENIKNAYVHNKRRYKWGLAILKNEVNKYTRVPLIPQYKYNKHEHRQTTEYFIWFKDEVIKWTDFYRDNKKNIVMGKRNIIEAVKIHKLQKERSMKEYRERMINRVYENISKSTI